jgi:NAD(P)-dependent dehydrogenase (short-subunit alcohol dehydrogenase family)
VRPEQLLASSYRTPALRTLLEVRERWAALALSWGPAGSVGFELATERRVTNEESDLDLVVRGAMLNTPILAPYAVDAMRKEMQVNVFGMASMIQAFAPILAKNGGGAIVNMLSVVSWFTPPSTLLMQPRSTRPLRSRTLPESNFANKELR